MSIITQALKKAQREQRQYHTPLPLQRSPLPTLTPARRRWLWVLIPAGGAAVVGAGLLFYTYTWRTPPPESPLAMAVPASQPIVTNLNPTSGEAAPPVLHPVPPVLHLVPPPQTPTPVASVMSEVPGQEPHVEMAPAAGSRPLIALLTEPSVTPALSIRPSQTRLNVDRLAASDASESSRSASRHQQSYE